MATQPQSAARLNFGPFEADVPAGELRRNGVRVRLSGQPLQILLILLAHPGEVVTREQLLRSVWGYGEVPQTRTVDQFIVRLRSKIETDPHQPRFLHTVYGDGYRLTPNSE